MINDSRQSVPVFLSFWLAEAYMFARCNVDVGAALHRRTTVNLQTRPETVMASELGWTDLENSNLCLF